MNKIQGSKPGTLSRIDLVKILKGAGIVAVASVLTYFAEQVIPALEDQELWFVPILAVTINTARKFWADTTKGIALLLLLAVPTSVMAHDGHEHKVGRVDLEKKASYVVQTWNAEGHPYVMVMRFSANGVNIISMPIDHVVGKDDQGNPPPPIVIGDNLKTKVGQVASALNDPDTAAELSIAYSMILIRKDRYDNVTEMQQAAKAAKDAVLKRNNATDTWAPYNLLLSQEFVRAAQEGRLDTVDEFAKVLSDVRDGLTLNAAGQRFDWARILDVVQLVVPLISGGSTPSLAEILEIAMAVIKLLTNRGMVIDGAPA